MVIWVLVGLGVNVLVGVRVGAGVEVKVALPIRVRVGCCGVQVTTKTLDVELGEISRVGEGVMGITEGVGVGMYS